MLLPTTDGEGIMFSGLRSSVCPSWNMYFAWPDLFT